MKTNRETIKQDLNEDIEMVMCTEDVVYTNTNAKELKELQDTFLKIERKGIRTLEALQNGRTYTLQCYTGYSFPAAPGPGSAGPWA